MEPKTIEDQENNLQQSIVLGGDAIVGASERRAGGTARLNPRSEGDQGGAYRQDVRGHVTLVGFPDLR